MFCTHTWTDKNIDVYTKAGASGSVSSLIQAEFSAIGDEHIKCFHSFLYLAKETMWNYAETLY